MTQWFRAYAQYLFAGLLCAGLLLAPELAAAAVGDKDVALKNFASIASAIVHIGTAIAIIIIQFMPAVWGADLITGPAVTEGITPLWVYVRNLTNIGFVGMILVVAAVNLATSGGNGSWSIKAKLGPIILGLVAINFSMLAVRVMVDAVNVGTVALISIADPVLTSKGVEAIDDYYELGVNTETYETCEIPDSRAGKIDSHNAGLAAGAAKVDAACGIPPGDAAASCQKVRCVINDTFCASGDSGKDPCLFQVLPNIDTSKMENPAKKNIMLGFGFFFMHLESLPQLSAKTGDLFSVVDSIIFSLVMGMAFLIALIAIFVVLLIRVVMMWLFMIFSPLLVTGWVFGFQIPVLGDQFWKYLLVPVKVAGALAFSMVMLATLQSLVVPPEVYTPAISPGPAMVKFWGDQQFGGFKLVWQILTVILFWKVVFDFALKDLEGVDGIVNGIKGFGATLGSTALTFAADKVKVPSISGKGDGISLAQVLPGGALNPNTALRRGVTNLRTTGQWNTGGLGAEARLIEDLERLRNDEASTRKRVKQSGRSEIVSAFRNESRSEQKQIIIDALKLAFPSLRGNTALTAEMNADDLNNILRQTKVLENQGPKDENPPQTTTAQSAKSIKTEFKVRDDQTIKVEIDKDKDLNAITLNSAGFTKDKLEGVDLSELSEKIATEAGLVDASGNAAADKAAEIKKQLEQILNS